MNLHRFAASVFIACLCSTAGTAQADKPSWAGGKHGKHDRQEQAVGHAEPTASISGTIYFSDTDRRIATDYFGTQIRAGKCPPGLAKKNNGCMPPGQAKKWARGRPLPAGVYGLDLPGDLLRRLPPPPPRHRYIQVAGDILMIAIGTNIVVDALEDLLR